MILSITDSRFLLSEMSCYIFLSSSSKDEYIKIMLSCFSWIMLIKDIMIKNYWDTDIIKTEIWSDIFAEKSETEFSLTVIKYNSFKEHVLSIDKISKVLIKYYWNINIIKIKDLSDIFIKTQIFWRICVY